MNCVKTKHKPLKVSELFRCNMMLETCWEPDVDYSKIKVP